MQLIRSPLGKLIFDVLVGAVIGAGVAALALPDSATAAESFGAVIGGAVLGANRAAREALALAMRQLRGEEPTS